MTLSLASVTVSPRQSNLSRKLRISRQAAKPQMEKGPQPATTSDQAGCIKFIVWISLRPVCGFAALREFLIGFFRTGN